MVGLLPRKVLRDILASRWQFAAVVALVMLSVAMFIGAYGGYLSLRNSFDHSYVELGMADYWLQVDGVPQRAVAKLNAILGVTAEGRIVRDVLASVHEGSPEEVTVHVVSLPGNGQPVLNQIVLEEGGYFSGPYAREVLLHKKFASYHGFRSGDRITLDMDKSKAQFRVAGIVNSPEYLFTGPARNYGVVFMSKDSAEKLLDMKGYVNELALQIDDEAEKGATFERIGIALREYNIGRLEFKGSPTPLADRKTDVSRGYLTARVIGLKDQASDRILRMDLEAFSGIAIVFPVMFMSMAALTIYVLIGRLVQSQRPQIGVMKAVGYSRRQVLAHYLTYSLVIGVAGALAGAMAGLYLAGVFAQQYAEALNIPFVQVQVHWHVVLIGVLVTVAVCTVGGLLPALATANLRPAQSLRPPLPGQGARRLLERLLPTPGWLPMPAKLALRNLVRNPYRSLFLVMGTAFAVSLVLSSAVFLDSIGLLKDIQFNRIEAYDAKVYFKGIGSTGRYFESEFWTGVNESEPLLETPYRFRHEGHSEDSTLIGLPPDQDLTQLFNARNQALQVEKGRLLLTPFLRKQLKVEVGDPVDLEPINGVVGVKRVVVGGFVEQPFDNGGYLPLEEVQQLLKAPGAATGFMVGLDEAEGSPEVVRRLYELPETRTVEFKAESRRFTDEVLKFYYYFTGFMLVFGLALGIMIVFSGITVSVDERLLEMGTLRTIGAGMKQVAGMITIESLVLSGLGIAAGVPLGNRLADYFANMYQAEDFNLPITIFPQTYVLTVLGLLLVLVLSELPSLRRISRLKLASVIRQWMA
ncbi:MAG: ABC transporter permease [Chloroflexi bacterium]|nr:ABC transporter permease [Chloroflexota bacterium]